MLYKYSDYIKENSLIDDLIKEGSEDKPSIIYWSNQLEKISNIDWTKISTEKYTGDRNKFYIKFYAYNNEGKAEYGYYQVLVERKGADDFYFMEDNNNNTIGQFQKKFTNEFWKNASEYVEKMKYDPKCLGDISHVRSGNKYNL